MDCVRIDHVLIMKIELSIDLVNRILAYLGKRPYEEVFQLIGEVHEAAQPKEKKTSTVNVLND